MNTRVPECAMGDLVLLLSGGNVLQLEYGSTEGEVQLGRCEGGGVMIVFSMQELHFRSVKSSSKIVSFVINNASCTPTARGCRFQPPISPILMKITR